MASEVVVDTAVEVDAVHVEVDFDMKLFSSS